jgi:hypothetical protein
MANPAQKRGAAAPAVAPKPAAASQTLEDRLRPWLDQGEYLLPLVVGIMAWAAGWVDLVAYQSPANPIIFGRYAPAFFLVLVAYTLGFGAWFWLIRSLRALERFKQGIAFVQRRPWIYALAWLGFAVLIYSMFVIPYWTALPLLQVGVLAMMLVFSAVVLLARPVAGAPFHPWRKLALGLIAALLVLEAALHGLARLNALPVENSSGLGVPYGRVYQSGEGLANAVTNRYGWYYPDFRLQEGSTRIVLSGDTFVQALQVPMEAHMGLELERRLAGAAGAPTEILAQGQIGYGSTMFLNPIMYPYIWEQLQPSEIVVFFHLANDFQLADHAADPRPRYTLGADGAPVVLDEDFAEWHLMAHEVIKGHDPVNPIRTVFSHALSLQLALDLAERTLGRELGRPSFVPFSMRSTAEAPFGPASHLFAPSPGPEAEPSFALAAAQLRTFAQEMRAKGIAVRLVTIPFFPEAALAAGGPAGWSPTFGAYDSLAPERVLEAAAREAGVPLLAMGRHLQATGVSADELRGLFFDGGRGHLTEAGHAYFAQTIYDCFYGGQAADEAAGCIAPGQ